MDRTKIETLELFRPPLTEVVDVLRNGLQKNFANVDVTCQHCPNLTLEPFCLKAEGICGSPVLQDVGGVKNLLPTPKFEKTYNFDEIAEALGRKVSFVIGAGAGPHHLVGVNCEMMANIVTNCDGKNGTYTSEVNPKDASCILKECPHREFSLLGNFLMSDAKRGEVIKIKASKRTGETNFVSCVRETLKAHYGNQPIGLGGVFLIVAGKAKMHIMSPFSSEPLMDDAEVNKWLRFYNMRAPLVCLSTLVSHDPGLDLRVEHTHCFSHHGEGGHYHYDTTPDEIEYEAYYTLAEKLYRIDRAL